MNAGLQHCAECGRCAGELVAEFTNEDFAAAATETSPKYEGVILARALHIAKRRTGMSFNALAAEMDMEKNTLYRRLRGGPIARGRATRIYLALLMMLDGKIH